MHGLATNSRFGDNQRSAVRLAIRIPDSEQRTVTFPFMDFPPELHYRIIAEVRVLVFCSQGARLTVYILVVYKGSTHEL